LTAKALAERAGVGVDTITRLEKGRNEPESETIEKLSEALSYPLAFFTGEDIDEVDVRAVSFRSFSKMTARERNAAIAAGSLGLLLNRWIEDRFGLPEPDFPAELSNETDPELAATRLRQQWGIGQQPIGNLLGLLETKGIRMLSLSENTASVNAFSFWRGGKPYVFLNNFKSAESSRFDAAHELGHLVLHRHGDPKGDRSLEKEANSFASAFLMPADDVRARAPRIISTEIILKTKQRWRVSAMALAYRLHHIGRLSDWQHKSICIDLSRRGYRSGEPIGIERETSVLWKKVLTILWQERVTRNDISDELGIPIDELDSLIGSLIKNEPSEPTIRGGSLSMV
jgi:Zn-dependent peptidase ImmA (M78 family)/DNA-binding XRE family transcriptional regulator